MAEKKKNDDAKYFYAVVAITFSIVAIIMWQLFFVTYQFNEDMTDPSIRRLPNIDLVFFESSLFSELKYFRLGDEPLLPWEKLEKVNPFKTPKVPEDREVREWWKSFNIVLEFDNDLILKSPEVFKGLIYPDLILFENRWYEIAINENENECDLVIVNESGDLVEIIEKSIEEEKTYLIKAENNLFNYYCNSLDDRILGQIVVIAINQQEDIFENGLGEIDYNRRVLETLGVEISNLYSEITESEVELEDRFSAIFEQYSILEAQYQNLRNLYFVENISQSEMEIALEEYIFNLSQLKESIDND